MSDILIGSQPYLVYADVAEADEYAAGALHADTWRASGDDTKQRALITATRILDRQSWKTAYQTFETRVDVENIRYASIEMAIALVDGSELQSATTAVTQKRIKAGSVEIENFRGAEGPVTRFPRIVTELLKGYVGGDASAFNAKAAGVDRESIYPLDYGFKEGI